MSLRIKEFPAGRAGGPIPLATKRAIDSGFDGQVGDRFNLATALLYREVTKGSMKWSEGKTLFERALHASSGESKQIVQMHYDSFSKNFGEQRVEP
jgi:hypothetical protein